MSTTVTHDTTFLGSTTAQQQCPAQALRHNAPAPHFEIHMVDKHSIRKFVPDMPPEFDRLPYPAATSDLVRTALLAHHGGAYLDTDFLLAGPMAEYTGHLSKADFVGYESFGQDCKEGRSVLY